MGSKWNSIYAALGYVVSALADNPHEENFGYYEPKAMPDY